MVADSKSHVDQHFLEILVGQGHLPVSYVSSLLRVLQAAVREVARSNEDTRQPFDQEPQPIFHLSAETTEDLFILRFTFSDPLDSKPLSALSKGTFSAFMKEFSQLLKALPQPSLWGSSVGGAGRRAYTSEVSKRLDQVRLELRHFPRVTLRFDRYTILFEGDRLEIG